MSTFDDLKNYAQSPFIGNSIMALGTQDLYTISDTQKLPLGTKIRLADGRAFVYGKAGAADLAPGKINQSVVPTEEDQAVTVTAAVGTSAVTVNFDGAQTANALAQGYLYVNDDTGEPQLYTIKSHPAGTNGVTIQLNERIRTAITAAAGTVSPLKHPLDGVIVHPSPPTAAIVGPCLVTITASYYGWFQVSGPAALLTDGTIVIGKTVMPSASVDGAVVDALLTEGTPNTGNNAPVVGIVIQVSADTEYSLVNLAIPGY